MGDVKDERKEDGDDDDDDYGEVSCWYGKGVSSGLQLSI